MFTALSVLHGALVRFNTIVLSTARSFSWVMLALMVFVIMLQVFFRYVLNDALPWTEEAALTLMVWMMGTIAPTAYRWSGFVAIDMLSDRLAANFRVTLQLFLLGVATFVLWVLLYHSWKEYANPLVFRPPGINGLIRESGINGILGFPLDFKGSYIYLAMVFCFAAMLSVNIELIIRNIGQFFGHKADFPEPPKPAYFAAGAE
ncbi:MAG: TRAP transporter small permease subunit [Ahrensia sp.]|nr:TRAP transporter small permease subunit [Ahrensia sp.]